MNDSAKNGKFSDGERALHNMRLPGFITEESIGLGDLLKKASYAVGVRACGGCQQRAIAMNRWLRFVPKR